MSDFQSLPVAKEKKKKKKKKKRRRTKEKDTESEIRCRGFRPIRKELLGDLVRCFLDPIFNVESKKLGLGS